MCEFHDCNCNGLGDIWWTDKCMYFSSIDCGLFILLMVTCFIAVRRNEGWSEEEGERLQTT